VKLNSNDQLQGKENKKNDFRFVNISKGG
jgi:hypothetical protein